MTQLARAERPACGETAPCGAAKRSSKMPLRVDLDLKSLVRTIPDHPKTGIMFRDITTLLKDASGFKACVERLVEPYRTAGVEAVVAIEARGFILGGAVADRLGTGFIPLRKRGKLPAATISEEYALEYGTDIIEIHADAIREGERILIVDDLIATGGTAEAGAKLVRRAGGVVVGAAFIIDLPDLGGAAKLEAKGIPCHTLISFEGH
jgi:adenine phosphoribosyltransferase